MRKKILVLATGGKDKDEGGSGFAELVRFTRPDPILNTKVILDADIVVASNYEFGGVRAKADQLEIPFIYFPAPWSAHDYQRLIKSVQADLVACSGWLKFVLGIRDVPVINIHPGSLPWTAGLWGHAVHDQTINLFHQGKLKKSAVTMHFIPYAEEYDPGDYDIGPIFFELPVAIEPADTSQTLAARVNKFEHGWQAFVTNLVLQDVIHWDGDDPRSLVVPSWLPHPESRSV